MKKFPLNWTLFLRDLVLGYARVSGGRNVSCLVPTPVPAGEELMSLWETRKWSRNQLDTLGVVAEGWLPPGLPSAPRDLHHSLAVSNTVSQQGGTHLIQRLSLNAMDKTQHEDH